MKLRGRHDTYTADAEPFASGGHAHLHQLRGRKLVYKRYKQPVTGQRQVRHLEQLHDTGRRVLVTDATPHGRQPVSSINWPVDLISGHGGGIVGVVLPAIPSAYFLAPGRPRTLDFLLLARANPPKAIVRVPVLLRLAEILRRLDDDQLVHGDLSAKNIVWCAKPEPGAYLIDCDGLHRHGTASPHPVATSGWLDPRLADGHIQEHDHLSDRYALALAMYRGLLLNPGHLGKHNGRWQTPANIPPRLDPPIRRLLERGLDPLDGQARPTAAAWVQRLLTTYLTSRAEQTT